MTQDSPNAALAEWLNAGFSASDAQQFVDAVVPLNIAREWTNAGIEADDAVDYIQKTVPLDQAKDLRGRGIELWQINRTDTGYEVELEPWQNDPLERLPEVIEPGRFGLSVWSVTPWDGGHVENDVSIEWDGKHTVEWSVLSGSGVSTMSEVSFCGIAGWPDGTDLLVSYLSDNMERGFARLAAEAVAASGSEEAKDPQRWVGFATSLVALTEELLNSGIEAHEEFADSYVRQGDDECFEFDEVFRQYLSSAETGSVLPDFDDWIKRALKVGVYKTE